MVGEDHDNLGGAELSVEELGNLRNSAVDGNCRGSLKDGNMNLSDSELRGGLYSRIDRERPVADLLAEYERRIGN